MEDYVVEEGIMEKNPKEYAREQFVQIGKTILIYIALQVGLSLLAGALFFDDIADKSDEAVAQVLSALILLLVSVATVLRGMKKLSLSKQDLHIQKSEFGITQILSYTMVGMGLSMLGSIVVVMINSLIAAVQGINFVGPDFSTSGDLIYDLSLLVMILVIAPIFEELLFRGVILRTLQRYDTKFAIITSGILFGMMHMNLVQGIPTMLFGFVLAYVCIKSNSILPSMLIHFFNNLISFVAGLAMDNMLLLSFLGLLEITFIVYTIIRLIKSRQTIQRELVSNAKEHHYYKMFFNAWPIIIFIVLVVFLTFTSFAAV